MPSKSKVCLKDLQKALLDFSEQRDWRKFHAPKELALAASVEAGELLECFLWMSSDTSRQLDRYERDHIADEVADVMICCLNLCNEMSFDADLIIHRKMKKNARKYPVKTSRGVARKRVGNIKSKTKQ